MFTNVNVDIGRISRSGIARSMGVGIFNLDQHCLIVFCKECPILHPLVILYGSISLPAQHVI